MKKEIKTGKFSLEYKEFKDVYVINKKIELKGVTGTNFTHGKR